MKFYGIDNQSLELKITNYQFPENNDGDWDSNWLNIYINVVSKFGNWQTIDPSLLTWELQRLINWFMDLSENKKSLESEEDFVEPNLKFTLRNSPTDPIKLIRINFSYESRPKSAADDQEYYIEIKADKVELIRISSELQNELSKYPKRGPNT
jgi:hypothetical protein